MAGKKAVFIAWGGNPRLANLVAERLDSEGMLTEVGGQERSPSDRDYFLGSQILRQMRKHKRAIILAQWPAEGIVLDDAVTRVEFRPNLMFEWGFLLATVRPEHLYVYLVGIQRAELPSDLTGVWCEAYKYTEDVQQLADRVAGHFLENVRPFAVDPFRPLADWPAWEASLLKQARGEEGIDPPALALSLVHSIQPAFYWDTFDRLVAITKNVGGDHPSTNVRWAKQLVVDAAAYYATTENPSADPPLEQVIELIEAFQYEAEGGDQDVNRWLRVIRANFLGLSYRRAANVSNNDAQREHYMKSALKSFNSARTILASLPKKEELGVMLWNGYVLRNLGRTMAAANRKKHAVQLLTEAIQIRREILAHLKGIGVPAHIQNQLRIEVALAELDSLQVDPKDAERRLAELVATLKICGSETTSLRTWFKARAQAAAYATSAAYHDLSDKIRHLEA